MLVGFPVALYVVACVAFVAYAAGANVYWFRVALYTNVAGVAMAAVAAVPGFIDWAFGIPRGTPAKKTGVVHMAFDVGALALFGVNALIQWPHHAEVLPLVGPSVALTIAGVLLTVCAGFYGWKLVQKHHVGVDLKPEQRRYEPQPTLHVERDRPYPGAGHGRPLGG